METSLVGNAPGVPGSQAQLSEPLTKFDLDFTGGTPTDLVGAIEKGRGKPLNAIIPTEFANLRIPPLKMRSVTVPELFEALGHASQASVAYYTSSGFGGGGSRNLQQMVTSYGFRTEGPAREDSVWYFYHNKVNLPEDAKTCRFWQLAPFLNNYNIDDITTAIQTGYKMLGEPAPAVNFHKDTKLLIAVGESTKLSLIDDVLRQLQPVPASDAKKSTTSTPKSVEPSSKPAGAP